MKHLVIVESPTKAKTIAKFLGADYQVESSFGHVRDLPVSKMGIDIEAGFKPLYVVPRSKSKIVAHLKKLLKKSDSLILATDSDREGEAIAWHLTQALPLDDKKTVKRIEFHEITAEAIKDALAHPRELNNQLVDAQQARRVLDRLVGYELSPFLWKKVAKGLSAGRVQSAAVRLIAEKEAEIRIFKKDEYWQIEALLETALSPERKAPEVQIIRLSSNQESETAPATTPALKAAAASQFMARLVSETGRVFDKLDIGQESLAQKIADELAAADFQITKVEKKEQRRSPQPPFTTSTLQQTANHWLGFSAKQTMFLAQQLYEGVELGPLGSLGLITYMRTDSLVLSEKFLQEARGLIEQQFGRNFLPADEIRYKTKSKGAQEAHEAIRPTQAELTPEKVRPYLNDKQFKLYQLIWQRAVACQMRPAVIEGLTIDIAAGNYGLRSTGQTIKFPGYMQVYPTDSKEVLLPPLTEGQKLDALGITAGQHATKPPARFTDATLVKKLEELGIGRPSTYAPIISTIQERNYVIKEGRYLKPTEIGEIVNKILVEHFPDIVDYNFTANMEDQLDEIAQGQRPWVPAIQKFYEPFKALLEQKKSLVSKSDLEEETDAVCELCGKKMMIKLGRFGKFMACSGFPECRNTKPLNGQAELEPKNLGKDPATGQDILQLVGRFGPYVQLGQKTENHPKPKKASLKFLKDPQNVTLDQALKLLSLPRDLGQNPQNQQSVTASAGRFGPYVACDGEYRSIKEPDTVFEITLQRALELLAQPKAAGRGGKKPLKELGDHQGKKVNVLTGRFGAYLKFGTKNVALPKEFKDETKAQELTLEQAIKIISEYKK